MRERRDFDSTSRENRSAEHHRETVRHSRRSEDGVSVAESETNVSSPENFDDEAIRGNPSVLRAWKMYDWANSAYATAVLLILQFYFGRVIVPEDGFSIAGRTYRSLALWGFVNSAAAFIVFVAAPVLGAIADVTAAKKRFLAICCAMGATSAAALYLCREGDVWLAIVVFLTAQVCFTAGNVFYDAFLPQIAPLGQEDAVSSQGFAYGYLGGGIHFALALALVGLGPKIGIPQQQAARLGMLTGALWWGGFALLTMRHLREAPATDSLPQPYKRSPRGVRHLAFGLARVVRTARKVRRLRHLALFLVAFMIYSDGIQTVIKMAGKFAESEPLSLSMTVVMVTYLVVQAIAFVSALVCAEIAERVGAKRTLMATLVGWAAVVTFAYFMTTALHFLLLGACVGLVLGGSQALSRSLYASMIPKGSEAEFFGFYSVFSKFSAIWGPLIMALIDHWTGSSRQAILSMILFFVLGTIILAFVNEQKARDVATAITSP